MRQLETTRSGLQTRGRLPTPHPSRGLFHLHPPPVYERNGRGGVGFRETCPRTRVTSYFDGVGDGRENVREGERGGETPEGDKVGVV